MKAFCFYAFSYVTPFLSFNPFASFGDERGNSAVTWSIDVVDYNDDAGFGV